MAEREQWGSRAGFLLAAIGSAVGLGNIWRFPYVAYESGGGAFIVPYLFALLTAGIPLLVLEYAIGHRHRGSAPLSFRRLHRRSEVVGWWQVAISFVISAYYAVIVAWALAYFVFSFGLRWGDDPDAFLFGQFLRLTGQPGEIGGLVAGVVVPLLLVWGVTLGVLAGGVRRGIETANRVFVPLLVVVFLVLVLRAVTLPGASSGLDALFTPDWSAITSSSVWIAAYGQIFFSLSIAFAIMITYASYLPRDADLTGNAFIAGFSNSSFELLAGIGVFAALGFMASAQGVAVSEVATQGIGLAFVVFPQMINTLPAFNQVFGVLFFGSLVLAGLSSLISIVQTYVAAVQEKFGVGRRASVLAGGGAGALVSLVFATGGGLYLLDAADHFVNAFGVALVGLAEVVVVAWVLRSLPALQRHADAGSELRLGSWWRVALAGITPLLLGWMMVDNVRTALAEPYEGYPLGFLLVSGWSVAVAALLAGVALSLLRWRPEPLAAPAIDPGEPRDAKGEPRHE